MPSSPALRCSPGREMRSGENHKRGRSLEGALVLKDKDDDLALFSEMHSREREDFLLLSSDDFEDTFATKLKHFSDYKIGMPTPARGESSELLDADGDKNDYDWLLTPPETPLFPSLDDEPPSVSVASRGRPRSQPISISRPSTVERNRRSSRGSASPNRLSPSPHSGNSSLQSKGRPSSSPTSSNQRPATPTRRTSPPPSKASTSAPRSSTPTPRRMSTGSGVRGTSPVRTSRGNSASPKLRAWQSNIPGFSSEVPPNLRTSLADRPATYVRGFSPASKASRDSGSHFGRKSMSPTASRSNSSQSQERDRISSQSKGSADSGGDEDLDSWQSYHVGSLDQLASKRVGALQTNRAPGFPKKPTKLFSPSSAPKRSFESVLRQMDHRKTPQNMFRPLLSSVPSSTFYVGKASSAHHSLISRNSSVTTSSNASMDQGTGVAIDTEGSVCLPEDNPTETGKRLCPDVQEEVFDFEKMDDQNETTSHDPDDDLAHHLQLGNFDTAVACKPGVSEELVRQDIDGEISSTSDNLCDGPVISEVDSLRITKVCLRCGCKYHAEAVERDDNLCPDCYTQDNLMAAVMQKVEIAAAENTLVQATQISQQYEAFEEQAAMMAVPQMQLQVVHTEQANIPEHGENIEDQISNDDDRKIDSFESSNTGSMVDGPLEKAQLSAGCGSPNSVAGIKQLPQGNDSPDLKAGFSDGSGISILLKRSYSNKGHIVLGRSFIASTITCDSRDSMKSLRSSFGHGSTSASSSVDFSSVRSAETRVQRQLSGNKCELEISRDQLQTRPQSASSSGTSNQRYQVARKPEDTVEILDGDVKDDRADRMHIGSHMKVRESEENDLDASSTSAFNVVVPEETSFEENESSRATDASSFAADASHCLVGSGQIEDHHGNSVTGKNENNPTGNGTTPLDTDASISLAESSLGVDCSMDAPEAPTNTGLVSILEIQTENSSQDDPGSDYDESSGSLKSITNEIQDPSVLTSLKDVAAFALDDSNLDNSSVLEESTVMVDCRAGSNARSLTLEEATDTILFCSSIVNDLACQAATIAIEKENPNLSEDFKPTITILGKSNGDRKDHRGRTIGKRASKSMKMRQRQTNADAKPPSYKLENDENANEAMVRNVGLPDKIDGMKPPKLESKCNCTIM